MAKCPDREDGAEHEFVEAPDGSVRCIDCEATYAETLRGFSSNSSTFETPKGSK